jgi:hypothetical protein
MTFAEDIEMVADGEPIEGVVIGARGWDFEAADQPVQLWSEARPALDYKYDDDYGAPECHAVWAWTSTKVIFVSTYDGSTSVTFVPRHPKAGIPTMPGGG